MKEAQQLVTGDLINNKIHLIRDHAVILDRDLAELYGMETRSLKKAVKQNMARFPADFMFAITASEYEALRRHLGTISRGEQFRQHPFAFTEQGVAMLSSVLRSKDVIAINIEIMRAFVRMRRMLSHRAELAQKLAAVEEKYDSQFRIVFKAIRALWLAVYKIRILHFEVQNRKRGFKVKKSALFMR